jgi:putative CocE/NonD family hydrolase
MTIRIERDVSCTMRDGTVLRADIWRDNSSECGPSVLVRTPYSKSDLVHMLAFMFVDPVALVERGYSFVVQDVRGRFASDGFFTPFESEKDDGYDTIEWLSTQSWNDGNVGMAGASYLGMAQWLAACSGHKALRCIVPTFAPTDFYESCVYHGGALDYAMSAFWSICDLGTNHIEKFYPNDSHKNILTSDASDIDRTLATRPITDIHSVATILDWYRKWLAHPCRDEYWKTLAATEYMEDITIPIFHIGAWFDVFLGGTIDGYEARRKTSPQRAFEGDKVDYLRIGPWSHAEYGGRFEEIDYGPHATGIASGLNSDIMSFFNKWLKQGGDLQDDDIAPVKYFAMGKNVWEECVSWPPPSTLFTKFYFHSNGSANTGSGDGFIDMIEPSCTEKEDVIIYDPTNPVPTTGGNMLYKGFLLNANVGQKHQSQTECRKDVLCYTGDQLASNMDIAGPVKCHIFVRSSASDTDFTAKLVDVFPDGTAMNVCDGITRVRYRSSKEFASLMEIGKIYALDIDLWHTAYRFERNHRIRVDISSSNYPRYDANTNSGGDIARDGYEDCVVAENSVYHDNEHVSFLMLPLQQKGE